MTTMHLMQNAETINRLVKQGEFLLETFHAEYEKDPAGYETEFLRGNLAGWRGTLHTLYHDGAEEIVDRVLATTRAGDPQTGAVKGTTSPRHPWVCWKAGGIPMDCLECKNLEETFESRLSEYILARETGRQPTSPPLA
jgi:hypothetical protein